MGIVSFLLVLLIYGYISDEFLAFLAQILHCNMTAITTVVTIAEILKNNGLATEKSIIHDL